MLGEYQMRVRTSALFPFVLSIISFALVLVLVLSGANPNSTPDGYLLSFNTTSLGTNLIEISPISSTTATTAAAASAANATNATNVARDVGTFPLISKRSFANIKISSPTNASASTLASGNSTLSGSPNTNITISSTSNSNTTSAAPTLAIPQTSGTTDPAAIPISLIGVFFQLVLNTLANGNGPLQGIISGLVTSQKESFGVSQFYTMHLTGICQGTVANATATNTTNPFNTTRCVSYTDAGIFVSNLTSNISDATLVGGANITVPTLTKVPGIGKQMKSIIDLAAGVVLGVFVVALIGNGLSIILSAAAFFIPLNGNIFLAGAGITTLSTQLLQVATITSTTIAIGLSSSLNGFSDVTGLSVTIGGKFLGLIWAGYIAAQIANGYWINVWFVKFRTRSYKARQRTPDQMIAGYKAIGKEVLSDLRLRTDWDDTEGLIPREVAQVDIQHWNDTYRKM